MPRTAKVKKPKAAAQSNGNGIAALTAQLWQAAVNLRGSIEPADYKRYVLPIIFLRFLSLRYERWFVGISASAAYPGQGGRVPACRGCARAPVSASQPA
jgi:hypothetical protein